MTIQDSLYAFKIPSLSGKTAVVTGANIGIGYNTALSLSKAGASVVLACRDQGRGEAAVASIKKEHADAKIELSILDLSSLASVKAFADRLLAKASSLDLLVNNAAIMALPERKLSVDGYEMQFATNHLGHFALTQQLMPLLLKSQSARVVTVSSIAHKYGKIEFDNLQGERSYEGWQAYGSTKLANLLFSYELDRRAKSSGAKLISVAAHPGVAKTNILASGPQQGKKVLRTMVSELLTAVLAQSDAHGALPIIHASMAPDVNGGEFYGPNGFMQISGKPTKVSSTPASHDAVVAAKLWSASEELAKLK